MARIFDGAAGYAIEANTAANVELVSYSRGIYVGVTGNLDVQMLDNANVSFSNVSAGVILPIRVKTIFSTSTANNIVVIW